MRWHVCTIILYDVRCNYFPFWNIQHTNCTIWIVRSGLSFVFHKVLLCCVQDYRQRIYPFIWNVLVHMSIYLYVAPLNNNKFHNYKEHLKRFIHACMYICEKFLFCFCLKECHIYTPFIWKWLRYRAYNGDYKRTSKYMFYGILHYIQIHIYIYL